MIKYNIKNGKPEVVMSKDAAKEIRIAINGFKAGQKAANGKVYRPNLAKYIVSQFLNDENSKEAINTSSDWGKLDEFLSAVENKIEEMLK